VVGAGWCLDVLLLAFSNSKEWIRTAESGIHSLRVIVRRLLTPVAPECHQQSLARVTEFVPSGK